MSTSRSVVGVRVGVTARLGIKKADPDFSESASDLHFHLVGDTGIEPMTSSVSGKRATAAPIARDPEGPRRS